MQKKREGVTTFALFFLMERCVRLALLGEVFTNQIGHRWKWFECPLEDCKRVSNRQTVVSDRNTRAICQRDSRQHFATIMHTSATVYHQPVVGDVCRHIVPLVMIEFEIFANVFL